MIHQYLDNYIKDKILHKNAEMWRTIKMSGSIENEKSALIGQLYGATLRLYCNTQGIEEKNIEQLNLKEFNDFFISRLDGLEEQVEVALKTRI